MANFLPSEASFVNRQNQTLVKYPGTISGQVFYLKNLKNCDVYLLDNTTTVYADDIADCRLFIGPVSGPCYVRTVTNTVVRAACAQFRTRDCHQMTVYLFTSSDPHIERSQKVRFAPYNFAYPLQDNHFMKAGLNPARNMWMQVYDHNSGNEKHYEILSTQVIDSVEFRIDQIGDPINPCSNQSNAQQVINLPEVQMKKSPQPPKFQIPQSNFSPYGGQTGHLAIEEIQFEVSNQNSYSHVPIVVEGFGSGPEILAPFGGIPNKPHQIKVPPPTDFGGVQVKQESARDRNIQVPIRSMPFEQTSPKPRFEEPQRQVNLGKEQKGVTLTFWYRGKQGFTPSYTEVNQFPQDIIASTLGRLKQIVDPFANANKEYFVKAFGIWVSFFMLGLFVMILDMASGLNTAAMFFDFFVLCCVLIGVLVCLYLKRKKRMLEAETKIIDFMNEENSKIYEQKNSRLKCSLYTVEIDVSK